MGRQALQEIHSALSGPSPVSHRFGRLGCRIKGLDSETKSAEPASNISSILSIDLSPPTSIIGVSMRFLSALVPGRK
jgi:hypothetical protein